MTVNLVRGKYVLVRADLGGNSQILPDGAVAFEDGVIVEVNAYAALRSAYPEARVFGNGRQFLLPGLVNAHHHGRGVSTLQMGQPDGSLETWIHRGWGRRALDPYLMALYTVMQQLRSGTTTVMYNQSPGASSCLMEEAEATIRAFREVGVRIAFSIGYRNQCLLVYGDDEAFLASLPSTLAHHARAAIEAIRLSTEDYLALYDDLLRRYPGGDAAVRILLSPANYHWCDEATHQRLAAYAGRHGVGVHTHLAETWYQRCYAERLHGQTPARRLYELGVLGPQMSVAHGVWLTRDDMVLLAEAGTGMCHNPSSNLRLHSGIAPVLEMLRLGVPVALGTDSTGINDDDDMFQEMGLAWALHRPPGLQERAITAHQVLHMATLGGARVTTFGDRIGALEPGRRADMVLVDWERISSPYSDAELDPLEVLVSRARAGDVQTVIVDGRIVYHHSTYPGFDDEAVGREISAQLRGPMPDAVRRQRQLYEELEPYLQRFYASWRIDTTPLYHYHSIT
jgi:cytosine/adenosine deaminase-related metal-dependent hydrolase